MHLSATERNIFLPGAGARLHARWRCLLTQGTMLTVLGVLAIALPVVTTVAIEVLIGMLLLVSGVWRAIAYFRLSHSRGFGWYLAIAVLAILLGSAMLQVPFAGIRTLTVLLFAFFVFEGVAKVLFAIDLREHAHGWGWPLATGALDLALAVLILAGWPSTAAWAIGLLVGVNMTLFGLVIVILALSARRARQYDLQQITMGDFHVPKKESGAAR